MPLVQLYVYDLSNGLARQLSLQLTGRQIDGIWHTSVVVFGKEVFYGQGISITTPGRSHHGSPLQILNMGETALDEETFTEYVQEMRHVYTAEKYHLLDFNCNSFTNDCIGFLTGGSIPSWIKDLPADFLSTPFGAALRPTIDSMFRRPTPSSTPAPSIQSQQTASELLQAVTSRATTAGGYPTPSPTPHPSTASDTVAAPIHVCSNPQSFRSLLVKHKAMVACFTSQTCPPCRMIEPVFESIALEKSSRGTAFVKIDIGAALGGSSQIATTYGVRVTPTFIFFLDGEKIHEMKGADASELRTQVDLLLFQAFPPHPHTSKSLPAIRAISLDPILYTQVPNLQAVLTKAQSFVQSSTKMSDADKSISKHVLSDTIVPLLTTKFDKNNKNTFVNQSTVETIKDACAKWTETTVLVSKHLPETELFPFVDLWRLALVDNVVSSWCAAQSVTHSTNPVLALLEKSSVMLAASSGSVSSLPKSYLLTFLRMLSNVFANIALARTVLDPVIRQPATSSNRQSLTAFLVPCLLHGDVGVRTGAASVAFNITAHYQKQRVEDQRARRPGQGESTGDDSGSGVDADWEVELVSAVLEALSNESSEEVVHRLAASLALILHLSPFYVSQLQPLVDVLQAKDMLMAKLSGNESILTKKEVKNLVRELAEQLC